MTVSQYRYMATDLITGAVKGDWIPLTVQNMSRVLNGAGSFLGSLNLTAGNYAEAANWRAAVEPRHSVLWLLLDGVPAWNGIVWDQPHMSALDGLLPLNVSTIDSLFAKRLISDTLTFTNADVFDVFRGLANYALTKDVNCAAAGLNFGTVQSGITDTIVYNATDMKQVGSAWSDLVATYGFEYAFRAGLDSSGNLTTFLDLGYPELGQQYTPGGLAYNLPGNLIDYRWTRTGSSSANKVVATAQASDGSGVNWQSQYPHGYDLVDLAAGNPLLETAVSLSTVAVTEQAQIDAFADGVLPATTGTQLTPTLTLGNEQGPSVRDITLGSWCQLALTSPLHPAMPDGSPGYQGLARITGWTLYPPSGQQAEYTWIQTWIPTSAEQAGETGI